MTDILVVDDREDIRLSLSLLLEDHNYVVHEADSPQTGQLVLKEQQVSLILLDMNYSLDTTSGDEGIAFLQWLQASKINVPVIAMTAWSNVDLVVQAMKLGANDFIEKPWKNKHLLHIISQQLSLTSLQKENAALTTAFSQRLKPLSVAFSLYAAATKPLRYNRRNPS